MSNEGTKVRTRRQRREPHADTWADNRPRYHGQPYLPLDDKTRAALERRFGRVIPK